MMRQKKSGQLTTGRGLTRSDPGHDNAVSICDPSPRLQRHLPVRCSNETNIVLLKVRAGGGKQGRKQGPRFLIYGRGISQYRFTIYG